MTDSSWLMMGGVGGFLSMVFRLFPGFGSQYHVETGGMKRWPKIRPFGEHTFFTKMQTVLHGAFSRTDLNRSLKSGCQNWGDNISGAHHCVFFMDPGETKVASYDTRQRDLLLDGCWYGEWLMILYFKYLKDMNTDFIPSMFSLFAFNCEERMSIWSDSTFTGCFVSDCLSKTK